MLSFKKVKSGATDDLRRKASGFSKKAYRIIGEELTEAVLMAKQKHRFKARTGNLERAIDSEVVKDSDNVIGTLMIRDSIASYGIHVHDGHGSWKPDKFLKRARDKHFSRINNRLKKVLK